MHEFIPDNPYEISPEVRAAQVAEAERRVRLLARLRILLASGLVLFLGATWLLVRTEEASRWFPFGPGPSLTVRRHFEALNRGELRAAYELFSPRYRQQVAFRVYHELVVSHRRMFRTREVEFRDAERGGNRAVLETDILSADGEHYRARFTLVRDAGRWWIDDVRWGAAPEEGRRIFV